MSKLRQIGSVTAYNFRQWRRNPRIVITFALAFILCFLLSDKAVKFAREYETTMQIVEAFVWTMPFLSAGTPYYLSRIDRKTWLAGQALYIMPELSLDIQQTVVLLCVRGDKL